MKRRPSRARHVIVFAKAPRLGQVKSRLAAGIGRLEALRFHEATLARTLRLVAARPDWCLWLAVTPDDVARAARRIWRRLPGRVRIVPQGRGDLGVRMARAFDRLPPGPAILIGSDIPGITVAALERAFALLGTHDVAFGPARDGGYWLVGERRLRPLAGLFEAVRWSSAQALADTLANLPPGARAGRTATLSDVDTAADWRALRERPGQKLQ